MKKALICILILLSTFSLFAKDGNILVTGGPSFNTAYSVKTQTSVESAGLDLCAEFQLGKDSHLMIISEAGFSFPFMQNFKIYNYNTSSSLVLGSDFFIGLGFNTGLNRKTSFTLGAGPYINSLNVSDGQKPFSSISVGAEVYGSAKIFVFENWYLDASIRAGMTIYDCVGISFFDWNGKVKSAPSNTFTLTGRLGFGYMF